MSGDSFATRFRWQDAVGLCVVIDLPSHDILAELGKLSELLPEERAFAEGLAPLRRTAWVGGRIALRRAFHELGVVLPAVLPDERGAPRLPRTLRGSISHKAQVAVASFARI